MDYNNTEEQNGQPQPAVQTLLSLAGDLAAAKEPSIRTGVLSHIQAARSSAQLRLNACIDRLKRLEVDRDAIELAIKRTEQTGSWLVHELVSEGVLTAETYFRQLAIDLGVEYCSAIDPQRIVKEASPPVFRLGRTAQLCCRHKDGGLVIYTAPDSVSEALIAETIHRHPAKKATFRIVEPATVQAALEQIKSEQIATAASANLYLRSPHMSAKFTLVSWQAFLLGVFSLGIPMAFALWPVTAFAVLHILVMITFMIAVAIRFAAFKGLVRGRHAPPAYVSDERSFPIYSVLVALHKEAAVAAQIVKAMSCLDWPQSRLEVFYICEEGDLETREALARLRLPASHRILAVPPIGPRTKPKALNFGLAQCSGDLVVIYDAEDRPDPLQLREAWQRFCIEGDDVACLQAPLLVTNTGQGWLSNLFAAEYACHFQGLLPFLDRQGAPLPLGGTSNHFRRTALDAVGGWDPHNVTEDADLGIRLSRNGYRCSVIWRPTLEDAPTNLSDWIPQRTRWIKGWMQTFLVHNRQIPQIMKNIGFKNLVLFEILMTSFIFSPLLYFISIMSFTIIYSKNRELFGFFPDLLFVDLMVFIGGHLVQCALTAASWRRAYGTRVPLSAALTFPFYWLLGNYAAWRAVWKLIRSPFEWEKTRHRPVVEKHAHHT